MASGERMSHHVASTQRALFVVLEAVSEHAQDDLIQALLEAKEQDNSM
jgi:hypothetical protein